MDKRSLLYATYWRNSLADIELGKGGLTSNDIKCYAQRPLDEIATGRLAPELVRELFDQEPSDVDIVGVTIRPRVYASRLSHAKRNAVGLPEIVTPVVAQAEVDRDGRIFPCEKTFIPRDILEPIDRGSLAIGTVDSLDTWLTKNPHPVFDRSQIDQEDPVAWFDGLWKRYTDFWQDLLVSVTENWLDQTDLYLQEDQWLLVKNEDVAGASIHVLPLYDHLLQANPLAPLFDRYASELIAPAESCLLPNSGFSLRVGHASDSYPLADAQRDAMTHHLVSKHGDILGVNGPPGTGKTTLLLSIVASHWVQAAIDGKDPKIIAAASTNNQAVTNIIDAFAKDFSTGTGPLAGRWLPDVTSFGAYFPAAKKEQSAAEKYQTRYFFNHIEEPGYVDRAEKAYVDAARKAFPDMPSCTVKEAVDRLQADIGNLVESLATIETSWARLSSARQAAINLLGPDPHAGHSKLQQLVADTTKNLAEASGLVSKWEDILADEPWWMTFLSWVPAVATKRFLLAKKALKDIWHGALPEGWRSIDDIAAMLSSQEKGLKEVLALQQAQLASADALMQARQTATEQWGKDIEPVMGKVATAEDIMLADCDQAADTKIRFQAFLRATHYWEGRWLVQMKSMLNTLAGEKGKTGRTSVIPRWQRRMMITPCVVSTFYMLPAEMKVKRYNGPDDFVPDYLYDFIDLLIVDEAGQVLPEVAGASFSLAKNALVIGDTLQIEPIWSTKARVDVGNLLSAGILDEMNIRKDYDRLCSLGKTSAAGNVMTIAQCASRFHYDPAMARGMFLYEHRRCFDEIIGYSNDLCYHSKLIPMRGSGNGKGLLPAMGYLHVDGKCVRRNGGSRSNLLEAETIAQWIGDNRSRLETHYKKDISEIVGVVTPFGGQVEAISKACVTLGIPVGKGSNELTVGTVHSLQGAERPVVVFSPTYSKHANGEFIDKRASMLNVAVSRAKDSFLVFGDMDIFNPNDRGRPRGLLASFLFAVPQNALTFSPLQRKDLTESSGVSALMDAAQHDTFLLDVLERATQEVHVVSPWVREHVMVERSILPAMEAAVSRGTKVTIYSDRQINDKGHWDMAFRCLSDAGIELIDVPRLHSKIVVGDDSVLCIGSFNWLSAARSGPYARHETSICYMGNTVGSEIKTLLQSINLRAHPA